MALVDQERECLSEPKQNALWLLPGQKRHEGPGLGSLGHVTS